MSTSASSADGEGPRPFRPRRKPDVDVQDLDDEQVLHVPDGPHAAYVLNATGAALFSLCDGMQTEEEIAEELAEAYAIDYRRALAEVRIFLADLDAAGILVRDPNEDRARAILQQAAGDERRALRFLGYR